MHISFKLLTSNDIIVNLQLPKTHGANSLPQ